VTPDGTPTDGGLAAVSAAYLSDMAVAEEPTTD
jgi:hypothetical protein